MLRPVYTEPENCQDCYKCIRECPVKAIRIENNKASIIAERCVYCGHCTQVCPTGAKKIRDGLTRAKLVVSKHPGKMYMSLAPSYVSEFGDIPVGRLISAIKRLGFAGVSETALGAELVTAETERFLAAAPEGVYLSSACPVVVDYIRKYAPELTANITPIVSPMIAHAKILKELYGDDIKIIFAGPCIGKKSEADTYGGLVEVAITFKDLRTWFEREGIEPAETEADGEETFVPYHSGAGAMYPVEGGMLAGFRSPGRRATHMAFSDLPTVKGVLEQLDTVNRRDTIFMELLACKGGCINGPAKLKATSLAIKRYDIMDRCETGNPSKDFSHLDLHADFPADPQETKTTYPEYRIKEALAAVGKTTAADELNCSSCGYDTCRDFAVAMLEGRAEDNMCASYMRKVAHDKATALLQKIPAGVVIVNEELKIVDMNRTFAACMGEDTLGVYDMFPGMEGASLKGLCPFESMFRTVLATGEELRERRINEGERTWLLSIYNIQPQKQVFGLLQNLHEPAVRKEWMLEKTREVIRNHMLTVQKVAGLLGENAAYTDSTLRSIMEAYDKPGKDDGGNKTN